MTLSQSTVARLYMSVIEDVINGVRECFLDEGVDEQVLQELKQSWESKVQSNKALDHNEALAGPVAGRAKAATHAKRLAENSQGPAQFVEDARHERLFPVQIKLPAQQNSGETAERVLTIQVPESAIAGNQLQSVLTGPLIGATLALPAALATTLLQQHVTAALRGQQSGNLIATRPFNQQQPHPSQLDGATDSDSDVTWKVLMDAPVPGPSTLWQVDGGMESSDEDDDDDDEEDLDDDDIDGEGEEGDGDEGAEEEPLNSEDDVSEEDVSEMFDTENVVVCQYDKVTRSRNKWKFYFKDGVMNLQGKDYVFQKSTGDAEW